MDLKFRRLSIRPCILPLLIAWIAWPGTSLAAQNRSISGRVTDGEGAALPGATVTLVEPETFRRRTVTTDDEGRFSISTSADSAGLLTLLADAPGFAQVEQTIEVPSDPSAPIRLEFAMGPFISQDRVVTAVTVVEGASGKLLALGAPITRMNTDRQWEQYRRTWPSLNVPSPQNTSAQRSWTDQLTVPPKGSGTQPISVFGRIAIEMMHTRMVQKAKSELRVQGKTSILDFANTQDVVVEHDPLRFTLPALGRWLGFTPPVFAARGLDRRVPQRRIDASHGRGLVIPPAQSSAADTNAAGVKLFFVDTGESSGASIRMTVVNEGTKPVTVVGGAFLLEAVEGVTERDVAREIAALKSRKPLTVMIDAYCLNMKKPPPAAGMVMRLVPNPDPRVLTPVQRIASAARVLYDAQRISPDSDPLQYRHALLQWAIWTEEQKFTEQTFTQAFIDHSRENIESAGRRWTPALDAALRKLAPGRWRHIQTVFRFARLPMAGDAP